MIVRVIMHGGAVIRTVSSQQETFFSSSYLDAENKSVAG